MEIISDGIRNGKIPFPYQHLFLESPEIMFQRLKEYKPIIKKYNGKLHGYYPKFSIYKSNSYKIVQDKTHYWKMNVLSDMFNENVRLDGKPIYYDFTGNEAWIQLSDEIAEDYYQSPELSNAIVNYLEKGVPLQPEHYQQMSDLFFHKIRLPTIFKLGWAVGILSHLFSNLENIKWLDISAGYGDRLLVACSHNMIYHGYDPNIDLEKGHDEIIAKFGDKEKQIIKYEPFEDAVLDYKNYDIIFTSPPFYILETYSNLSNQSIIKYPEFDSWMINFLFKSIQKAWNSLKIGGYLALHISDTTYYQICEPMNLFIEDLPGSWFVEIFGVMSKNPTYKPQPVWIWEKTDNIQVSAGRLGKLYPQYLIK